MAQTRAELREQVRRALGHPFVKVELCDAHIDDAIDAARNHWIKWAVGNATHERWMTIMLKDGQRLYKLPSGVVEVVNYYDDFGGTFGGGGMNTFTGGGPQTLFSLDNAMYMAGFMNFYTGGGYSGYGGLQGGYGGHGAGSQGAYIGGGSFGMYNLVTYQLAQQMLGDMEHYHVNTYNWIYHRSSNQLELQPNPPCVNSSLTITTDLNGNWMVMDDPLDCSTLSAGTTATTFKSPGFVLLRTYMIEGTDLPTYSPPTSGERIHSIFNISDNYSEALFSETWIIDYATAASKVTLGIIRRKFAGYSAMGGQSIALDGDSLVSEGKEEMRELMDALDLKHAYEGYGIIIG